MEPQRVEQLHGPDNQMKRDQPLRAFQRYCREVGTRLNKCVQQYHVYENVNMAADYLTSRPLLLAAVIAAGSAILLPVLLFTTFAITTIVCTFTGFILIEGAILAFGSVILCGVLLSVITSILMLGAFLATAYYVYLQLYLVIKRF